jgi:DNA-binding response OmpR family regulator
MFTILVVEDDSTLNKVMCAKLRHEGYEVLSASDGRAALDLMDREHVDLIVSDVMMPGIDGIELIRQLRGARYDLPVLIVTAKGSIEDMESGFAAGTDDYMVKPISLKELVLRVKALLRRAQLASEKRLTVGGTVLDYEGLTVDDGHGPEALPPKEFYLLFRLLSHPGKVFTRLELLDEIWGMEADTDERNVDAHIKKLRKRYGTNPDFEIQTVRGLGYRATVREGARG